MISNKRLLYFVLVLIGFICIILASDNFNEIKKVFIKSPLEVHLSAGKYDLKLSPLVKSNIWEMEHITIYLDYQNNTSSDLDGLQVIFETPKRSGLVAQGKIKINPELTKRLNPKKVFDLPSIKAKSKAKVELYFFGFDPGEAKIQATLKAQNNLSALSNPIIIQVRK